VRPFSEAMRATSLCRAASLEAVHPKFPDAMAWDRAADDVLAVMVSVFLSAFSPVIRRWNGFDGLRQFHYLHDCEINRAIIERFLRFTSENRAKDFSHARRFLRPFLILRLRAACNDTQFRSRDYKRCTGIYEPAHLSRGGPDSF